MASHASYFEQQSQTQKLAGKVSTEPLLKRRISVDSETFLLPATPPSTPKFEPLTASPASNGTSISPKTCLKVRRRSSARFSPPSPPRLPSVREEQYRALDGRVFSPQNQAFVATVTLAARSSTRAPVQTLWNSILYSWFAPSEYIVACRDGSLNDACVLELRWIAPAPAQDMDMDMFPSFSAMHASPAQEEPAARRLSERTSSRSLSRKGSRVDLDDDLEAGFGELSLGPTSSASTTASGRTSGPHAGAEPRILTLQYWSSLADTAVGWRTARESLARHMAANVAPGRRMLCAVAIGARFELYGWDGAAGRPALERRHAGPLDLRLREDRCELERLLDLVERRGLEYTRAGRPWSRRTS
ncbi:hypothetical protein JX266_003935 [Neoarthrinium moseri]|nr:hypothetical protein JX266_003935 [Neoarthrinium moseri]